MQLKRIFNLIRNDFKKRVCNERGTWAAITAATIGAAGGIGSAMISSSGKGGGRELSLPGTVTDPYYTKSQEFLFPYGTDILKGDVPDYYKPIGEFGGQEFEDILGMGIRDIEKTGLETGARLKKRGGRLAAGIAGKVGDFSKLMRWDKYMQGIKGRQWLFGEGKSMVEGVRDKALTYGEQMTQTENIKSLKEYEAEKADEAAEGEMWSKILSSIIGGAGTAIGGMGGGATPLGSAAGGGGSVLPVGGGTYDLFGKGLGNF